MQLAAVQGSTSEIVGYRLLEPRIPMARTPGHRSEDLCVPEGWEGYHAELPRRAPDTRILGGVSSGARRLPRLPLVGALA